MINYKEYIDLLQHLISTPSLSREENKTADLLEQWISNMNIHASRIENNVWASNKHFDKNKPTILLNSHHDTVKPNASYTRDPFKAEIEKDKLYGLGSNDAGASLVALLACFTHFYEKENIPYNLIFLGSAEEEISGPKGVSLALKSLPSIAFGLVGEPTSMEMAIAEKGLLVIDGKAYGVAGHAAHDNTENAIYNALEDILKLKAFAFENVSKLLGAVKVSVTQVSAGSQHNVVPDTCNFVIDVRVNEFYSNERVFNILQKKVKSKLKARSFRLNSSGIDKNHVLIKASGDLGIKTFGSATLSDQSQMSFPTVKIGPGDTNRSHQSDEYIYLSELKEGIELYIKLLNKIFSYETLG